uniref:Uncharacterized protein n=1 Tax=Glossina palpalis gambiensis TaxID=67801 RepID=A0A1B0B159_9MUSC
MSCVEIAPFKNKICVKIRPTLSSVNNLGSDHPIHHSVVETRLKFGKACFLPLTILMHPNIIIGCILAFDRSFDPFLLIHERNKRWAYARVHNKFL